ncbi:MAG: hypothetical protein HRT98_04020 [Mycoplasmatales bacterium]|nr:hypothetical protein [Mycoplasmatales bacterium]
MHKKIIIFSIIMAILQIVVGSFMLANILNIYQYAKYIGIVWISIGIFIILLAVITFIKIRLVWIDRLFTASTFSLMMMLSTCWTNWLTPIAIIIYIPIIFMYLMRIVMRSKL